MHLLMPARWIKLTLVLLLLLIGAGSYIYNQFLIEKIREHESSSVELWAKGIEFSYAPEHEQVSTNLRSAIDILSGIPEVPDSVIVKIRDAELIRSTYDFVQEHLITVDRFQIPAVVVDEHGNFLHYNGVRESDLGPGLIRQFSQIHDPVEIVIEGEHFQQSQLIYYGESQTIQYLRYFPYVQFGLLALLLGIGYMSYRSITRSEQSNLWVGMAKETAHQLGTPISSLYGWIQLLHEKVEDRSESGKIVAEIENDVSRLRDIAERFNKIGSDPELHVMRLEPIIDQVIQYMENRLPRLGKQVDVRKSVDADIEVKLNPELFHWALENLIKNAMDAIRENSDSAYLAIHASRTDHEVHIDIEDSGAGIERKNIGEVFKPGFSTKSRGWGLGLSLTRRIIEDYHKGTIQILYSEPKKGTRIRISLKSSL